jgi:integrase
MARRRKNNLELPRGVYPVSSKGRLYWYYQPGRGTAASTRRIKLFGDPYAPVGSPDNERFWRELNHIASGTIIYRSDSIKVLIDQYRADDAFTRLSTRTQTVYNLHLNRLANPLAWGKLPARQLTPSAVKAARDRLSDTPGMANQMLSVGRTLYAWAIPLGLVNNNPFENVGPLDIPDRGHVPWPRWILDEVLASVPDDLRRMIRLGVMTCQRESDLVRMGPTHREEGRKGIWCRPQKTRRRRRSVFIPLRTVDSMELDRWAETPITFQNSRWKAPISRHNHEKYFYSPRGAAYTPTSLRARWNRWLRTEKGRAIRAKWKDRLKRQIARYEWEIDPEDINGPTIHGLRGTVVLVRWSEGYDVDQISNDVGMSRQTVQHYMRFKDQMDIAAAGQNRLHLVNKGL